MRRFFGTLMSEAIPSQGEAEPAELKLNFITDEQWLKKLSADLR